MIIFVNCGAFMTVEQQKSFLIKAAYYAAVIVLGLLLLKLLIGPLLPFSIAVILTVSIQGILRKGVKKFSLKKKPASVTFVLVLFTGIIMVTFFMFRALYRQLTELMTSLPHYSKEISAAINSIFDRFNAVFGRMTDVTSETVGNISSATLDTITEKSAAFITELLTNFVGGIPQFLLSLVITVIASVYIAKDYDDITKFVVGFIPKQVTKRLVFIKDTILYKLGRLIRGYSIIVAITFLELLIGLLLLKSKYALTIAAVTALVDVLPILGSGTVLIPWAIGAALMGNTSKAVGLIVLYLIIAAIRNVLEPKIIGDKLGVHPVIMLASLVLGLWLFGAVGVIIMPLLAVTGKSLIEERSALE